MNPRYTAAMSLARLFLPRPEGTSARSRRVPRHRGFARTGVRLAVLAACLLSAANARAFDFEWLGHIEDEAEKLSSDDVQTRRTAVDTLGRFDILYTRPHLMRALGDEDARVRQGAAHILAKHGVADAEPVIIEWLESADTETRTGAAAILASYNTPRAVAALVRSLGDPESRVRQRAAQALGTIGTREVVVPLIGRLEDNESRVRQTAIEQLARLGDARAVIPLVGAFNDSNEKVRLAAIEAVGLLGDKSAVPSLLRLLDDRTETVKSAAVTALGNLGVVAATDTLIAELGRGSQGYNSRVAYALGQLAGAAAAGPDRDPAAANRAVRALVAALAVKHTRTAASEALRNAGAVSVPALVAHLDGEIDGDLDAAVTLLRDIGDTRATPALVLELERGRLPATLVLEALERCGDERALIPILGLLSSTDDALRLRAMTSLRSVIEDARAAELILGLVDDRNLEIRVLAVEYLGLMRAPTAVAKLIELTEPGIEPRLRLAAVDALGEIADPQAAGALLRILEQGPEELYRAAANALIYIGDVGTVERLSVLARDAQSGARSHAIRALGGVLRDRTHPAANQLLRELAVRAPRSTSLAAVDALGAIGDKAAAPVLIELLQSDHHHRRAAARALGNLGDNKAVPALLAALGARDDRVSAEAAWALAKLADASAAEALLSATRRRGWATAVNAAAALAAVAGPEHARELMALLGHRRRFVRLNAATGLGRVFAGQTGNMPADVREALVLRLADDTSPLVRAAVIRALARIGGSADAIAAAETQDSDERVRRAAAAARAAPFMPPARSDWRSFHVVDPSSADTPVRQEPYFLVAADGVATAYHTDARGIITEERFPPGEYVLAPHAQAANY